MKRLMGLFLIVLLLGFCFGCSKKDKEDEGGYLVVEYHTYPSDGSIEDLDSYPYIKIFSDRKVEWGYGNGNIVNYDTVSSTEYNEIVKLAFSKRFTSLKEDLSDEDMEDGDISYITIHYENGDYKRVGGTSPTNDTYIELESKLEAIFNKDH